VYVIPTPATVANKLIALPVQTVLELALANGAAGELKLDITYGPNEFLHPYPSVTTKL
jgi:hypothetical protein